MQPKRVLELRLSICEVSFEPEALDHVIEILNILSRDMLAVTLFQCTAIKWFGQSCSQPPFSSLGELMDGQISDGVGGSTLGPEPTS